MVRIKLLALASAIYVFTLFVPGIANADTPDPDFVDADCPRGEQLVTCGRPYAFRPYDPFELVKDECIRLENNPEYHQLVVKSKTRPGETKISENKFCYQPRSLFFKSIMYAGRYLLLLLVTLLLEIPIFLLFGYRTFASIIKVVLANVISVLGLYIFGMFIPYRNIFVVVGGEVLVIMFEAIFLHEVVKNIGYWRAIFGSIIANLISATIGFILVRLILYS